MKVLFVIFFGIFSIGLCFKPQPQNECCQWVNHWFVTCKTSCHAIVFNQLNGRMVSVKLESSATLQIDVPDGQIEKIYVKTEFQFDTMCVENVSVVKWQIGHKSKACAKESTTMTSTTSRTTSASTIRTTSPRRPTTSASTTRTTSQRRPTTSASTDSTTSRRRPTTVGTTRSTVTSASTTSTTNTTTTDIRVNTTSTSRTHSWTTNTTSWNSTTTTDIPPTTTSTHPWIYIFIPLALIVFLVAIFILYRHHKTTRHFRPPHATLDDTPNEETSLYVLNPTYEGTSAAAATGTTLGPKTKKGKSRIPRLQRSPYETRSRQSRVSKL